MEFIFELLAEMLVEGGFAIGSDRKRSRWLRYAVLGLLMLFFAAIDLGLLLLGIRLCFSEPAAGWAFIILGSALTGGSIVMFRNKLK